MGIKSSYNLGFSSPCVDRDFIIDHLRDVKYIYIERDTDMGF